MLFPELSSCTMPINLEPSSALDFFTRSVMQHYIQWVKKKILPIFFPNNRKHKFYISNSHLKVGHGLKITHCLIKAQNIFLYFRNSSSWLLRWVHTWLYPYCKNPISNFLKRWLTTQCLSTFTDRAHGFLRRSSFYVEHLCLYIS